jgi:protein TonB
VEPIRVGTEQNPAPVLLEHTDPVRPPRAIAAHIAGTVVVDATIDPDGNVVDAVVITSIPLLDAAAIDAIKQWKYARTFAGERPVTVILTVPVVFKRE